MRPRTPPLLCGACVSDTSLLLSLRSLVLARTQSPGTLCPRSRPAGGRTLDKREHSRREQGNGRDEHRRRECPGEPVLHLTDEDVTEPTAGTCQGSDRRGGDDE